MLFLPITIKNLHLRNRIVMPPMCMYSAESDGIATEWHKIHYGTRAVGGVDLVIVEATAVSPEGRISKNDLGLWNDNQINKLKDIANIIKAEGAVAGIQLNHAGRKSYTAIPIAPSPIPFPGYPMPRELNEMEIKTIIRAFRDAALRADRAGFDLIEIHAAHGYIINEFLSPLTNNRFDRYGGSENNRVQFLTEIITAVRTVWPNNKTLAVRISAEEYHEDGLHPQDYGRIMSKFKNEIDLIDVSSGAVIKAEINTYPGYQLGYAATVKQISGIAVIGGGLITETNLARMALESNFCDLVYLGRELLRNPYFPQNESNKVKIPIYPKQYRRAY